MFVASRRNHWDYIVTLSGETVVGIAPGGTATAGIRINVDGTVDKNENLSYSQIDASTDWVTPNVAANSNFQVMATLSDETYNWGNSDSLGTWLALSQNREWAIQTSETDAFASATLTISIRRGTGSTLDSVGYALQIDTSS